MMYYYCCATRVANNIASVYYGIRAAEEDVVVIDFDTISSFVVCFLDASDIYFVSRDVFDCAIN